MNIFTTGQSQFDYNKATQKVNNSFLEDREARLPGIKMGCSCSLSSYTPEGAHHQELVSYPVEAITSVAQTGHNV